MSAKLAPDELDENATAFFDPSTKEYVKLEILTHENKTVLKFVRKAAEDGKFDRGSHERRHSKEDVLKILGKIKSIEDFSMHGFMDINDEMFNALMKINFGNMTFNRCRVTSSFDAFIHFLKINKHKVSMKDRLCQVQPGFINDEVLGLLKKPLMLRAFSLDDSTSTKLTDAFLASLDFGEGGVNICLMYKNSSLTFGAIKKFAEETKIPPGYPDVGNNFGDLDGKQIPEVINFVRAKNAEEMKIWKREVNVELFSINGKSTLEISNCFANKKFRNGFAIPLDEIASVDMATLINPNTVEMYRKIKDDLLNENDSVDAIPKAQYQFAKVKFSYIDYNFTEKALHILAKSKGHVLFYFIKTALDRKGIEKTIAKFIRMCSHIDKMQFNEDIILTDEFYGLLKANADSTTTSIVWSMTESLSAENRANVAITSEGLFDKFGFNHREDLNDSSSDSDSDSSKSH